MSARQVLALGSAALGALAALNSALATPPPIEPVVPGEGRVFRWMGEDVRYTVCGDGPAIFLLHGIGVASSSYEMRYIVEPLARQYRVYTVDLLGFGQSARPRIVYSADLYEGLIAAFLREVIGGSAGAVGVGLSGSYLLAIAAREPSLLRALVLSAPPPLHKATPRAARVRRATDLLLGAPVLGQSLYHAMTARSGIRSYLRDQAYSNRDLVTESMVDAQYATAHQPNARHAAQAYLTGRLARDVVPVLPKVRQPLLLAFGADARPAPAPVAAGYVRLAPRSQVLLIERCGALPHEEQAERFADAARSWLEL